MRSIYESLGVVVKSGALTPSEHRLLSKAAKLLESKMASTNDEPITSQHAAINAARLFFSFTSGMAGIEYFNVMYLDNANRVIATGSLNVGTINACAVYVREVVKSALEHNAVSVILSHNHPTGDTSPSRADREITSRIKDGLDTVDIALLDHIIIGGANAFSFAADGLM